MSAAEKEQNMEATRDKVQNWLMSEGWQIAEPGKYTLQVACESNGQSLVSNPLAITVAGPDDFGEERFAQDYFSDDVARILTFGGSMVLDDGNKALEQIVERLPKRRAAIHARVALRHAFTKNTTESHVTRR